MLLLLLRRGGVGVGGATPSSKHARFLERILPMFSFMLRSDALNIGMFPSGFSSSSDI